MYVFLLIILSCFKNKYKLFLYIYIYILCVIVFHIIVFLIGMCGLLIDGGGLWRDEY